MIDYAELADLKAFARQPDALSDDGWQLLLTSASRLFDIVCEVETDFFARPSNPQYYTGDDSELLAIGSLTDDRRVHSVAIENDAYTISGYSVVVVAENTFLATANGEKWESPHRVRVRADWEVAETPVISKDISQAVIEIALHIWRKSDPSFASISAAENSILLEELPPTARITAEKYRAMYSDRCLFA